MNRLSALGLFTVIGLAAAACSDDDDGPSTPAAGSGGMGGSMTTGGMAGDTGGTTMNGGNGGSTMGEAPCNGCVELTVPFAGASEAALYQFNHNPPIDMSNATVTWRVMVSGGSANTFLKLQLQNGAPSYFGHYSEPQMALTTANFPAGQWVDVTLDTSTIPALGGAAVEGADAGLPDASTPETADAGGEVADAGDAGAPAAPTGFDKSQVEAVQLQVGSLASLAAAEEVTVLIDSVTFTGVAGRADITFDANAEGLLLNNYDGSPTPAGTPAPEYHQ